MCGIFGYISKTGAPVEMSTLARIAEITETRGPHAFGFSWIDGRGRLRMFKQSGRVSHHLEALSIASDARMLIGHCRYATHGSPDNNLNNHPHPCDGGWIVHNGVVANYLTMLEEYQLHPVTECDSEVLSLMVEEMDGHLTDRMLGVASLASGCLATMGLWRSPRRLVAVRNGNPLHIGTTGAGFYLASLRTGLPGTVSHVKDASALSFHVDDKDRATLESHDLDSVELV